MMVRSSPRGVLIAIVLLLGLIGSAAAKRPLSYCKCVCGPARNYTIAHLLQPTNPSRPCADCTRAFCFDQGVQECPEESRDDTLFAVSTECFQRESRKDEVIIVAFLLTTYVSFCSIGDYRMQARSLDRACETLSGVACKRAPQLTCT